MKILVIGDLHLPYSRVGYLDFCKNIYKKYNCNKVIFIGDVVDFNSVSFYVKHPEMPNALKEYELAYKAIQKWRKAFPKALVTIGNHDSRIQRVAGSVNIPSQLLKNYSELWNTPKWKWDWDFKIDGVYYFHGTGTGGIHPAYTTMRKMAMSTIIGHNHHACGIKWLVNPDRRLFGMDVGAGCDDRQLAFAYNKHNKIRSVIACGVVINSIPYIEIMPIAKDEKYHDLKYKK